jgi:processive 1,2-diacylglycerol beta-glucosyltransferase
MITSSFMFNKVLILSASAGAGHMRAAQALEHAFKEMNAAREVRHIDTLEYTNAIFRKLYADTYIKMVGKTPHLLGWFYDQSDKPFKNEQALHAFNKLNTRPFVSLLHEYQPDLLVCTHFLPSEIISRLKAKERLKCPQAIVVTDLDVHGMWLCRDYEHYFVAIDESRVLLNSFGVPENKITVTGIPIDPIFSQAKDKKATREKLGLKTDLTTILISAGGFGVGPIEKIITSLLTLKHSVQIIAICGRNKELKTKIEKLANRSDSKNTISLKVIGFTTEMDDYMTASDILVGKPGGLTSAEALAKGLVMVIVNPIPGQEARNSDHFLEGGVAIRCNNLPTLAYKIDKLLDDPERFKSMQANVRKLARPHAARDIVRKLLELL